MHGNKPPNGRDGDSNMRLRRRPKPEGSEDRTLPEASVHFSVALENGAKVEGVALSQVREGMVSGADRKGGSAERGRRGGKRSKTVALQKVDAALKGERLCACA